MTLCHSERRPGQSDAFKDVCRGEITKLNLDVREGTYFRFRELRSRTERAGFIGLSKNLCRNKRQWPEGDKAKDSFATAAKAERGEETRHKERRRGKKGRPQEIGLNHSRGKVETGTQHR